MSAGSGGVAGITGTPAEVARLRAATLLPSVRMISGVGPTKMTPSRLQASTNSGFSERKPYPGWMASAFASTAMRRMSSMSR